MAAGVVECAQAAAVIAQHDEGLGADAHGAPVAGTGQLLLARHRDPAPVPERLQLALVVGRVVVPGGRQPGFKPFERFPCHVARVKL